MARKKSVFCSKCFEYVKPEDIDACWPLKGNGCRVMACPCCCGWGEHHTIDGKKICTMCGGKRMVIEKKMYERVKDIELK